MKINRLKYASLAALAALSMVPGLGLAQPTNIPYQPVGATVMTDGSGNQCQSSGGGAVWQNWFVNFGGGVNAAITNYHIIFDTTNPPPTGSVGSMLQVQSWEGVNSGTLSTYACIDGDFWGGQKVNMQQYQAIEMDFRADTTSDMQPTNQWGVNIGVDGESSPGNRSSVPIATTGVFNTGNMATNFDGAWHHLSIPIPADVSATSSEGPGFQIFHNGTTAGTFSYWVANIVLIARTTVPPPPTMSISRTSPGLRQFANAGPSYNRQDLRTDTAPAVPGSGKEVDWVGHPGAKYSWTFSDWPGPGHGGFQAALTFTPDPAESVTYADPDWSSTNALWINLNAQNDGTVTAIVRCKTNQPSNNGQMFGAGTGLLGTNSMSVPGAIGTWSVTFTDDSHLTLTAPNGASTNVVLDAGFGDPLAYTNISFSLYTTMASDANAGQSATLTSFKVTGVVNPIDENLTDGGLNTPGLRLQSQGYNNTNTAPPNQVFLTTNDSYWLGWTLPAPKYSLVTKTTLTASTWLDFAPTPILPNGSSNLVRVPTASLPSPTASYFALEQRTNFTQLQVLLPGESPAPNTPTGKTGSPTPISISSGLSEDVTVRACDPNWNLINVTDTINLTTDEPNAILPAGNVAMVAGVATFTGNNAILFTAEGTWTVTATNMSRVMPSANSSPLTVTP